MMWLMLSWIPYASNWIRCKIAKKFTLASPTTNRCGILRFMGMGQGAKGKGERARGKGQRAKGKGQGAKGKGQRAKGKRNIFLFPVGELVEPLTFPLFPRRCHLPHLAFCMLGQIVSSCRYAMFFQPESNPWISERKVNN